MRGLEAFVGQERVKALIRPEIVAARRKGLPFSHTLLYGPPGLGKSRLAHALGEEMGQTVIEHPAPKNLTLKETQRFLLGLPASRYYREPGNMGMPMPGAEVYFIFLDEVHLMPGFEAWYQPMEEGHLTLNGAPSWLPYFTLVAATTELKALPRAFTRRFNLEFMLEPYSAEELARIITQRRVGFEHAEEVARRSRGSAAFAINYAERVENFGGLEYFEVAGIDASGMTEIDRRYIEVLTGAAGPMSLASLAARLQQDADTVKYAVEPFLISLGILEIIDKGRRLTEPGRGRRAQEALGSVQKMLKVV